MHLIYSSHPNTSISWGDNKSWQECCREEIEMRIQKASPFSREQKPCSWLHMTVGHFPTKRNHAPDYIWRSDIFQRTETMLLTTYDRRTFSREQKPCSWLHMTVGHFPLTIMKDGLFHTSNPDCRKCQTSSFFGLEDMRHCRIFSRHEFRTFSCINFPKEGLGHLPA